MCFMGLPAIPNVRPSITVMQAPAKVHLLISGCDSLCNGCTGPSNTECSACSASSFFHSLTSQCLATCPDGFYGDSGLCKGRQPSHTACHQYCATCTAGMSSNCPTCATGHFAVSATECDTACYSNQYSDASNICHGCDIKCLTCSGAGSTNCLSCSSSTYAFGASTCLTECP